MFGDSPVKSLAGAGARLLPWRLANRPASQEEHDGQGFRFRS